MLDCDSSLFHVLICMTDLCTRKSILFLCLELHETNKNVLKFTKNLFLKFHFMLLASLVMTVTGMEYIEEGMNDAGTAPSFFCKLCDCSFTDIMGKLMHAKGRRHRLAYKVQTLPCLHLSLSLFTYTAITISHINLA